MSVAAAATAAPAAFPRRIIGFLRDLFVGTLLCMTPLTSIIALGWITRNMDARIKQLTGGHLGTPGWVLGDRGHGVTARLFGGLAANVKVGLRTAFGLALLTLPFTLFWLGAWWAGWENSFNKGYEQSNVGPLVWFAGTALSLPILALLPMAIAHMAAENRLSALFEWRRLRRIVGAAGWRLACIAILSVILSVPFLVLRAIPVFIEDFVPGFADMAPDDQYGVAMLLDVLGAMAAFAFVWFIRLRAASVYALTEATLTGRTPVSRLRAVWFLLAAVTWLPLSLFIVVAQFLNYDPWLWLTHPAYLLPWI
ncbi:MAG: hypothetical protein AAF762_11225 [Pseudomonadota bacterium]